MRTFLDLRGLVFHCLHAGKDPDATRTAEGAPLNTIGYTLDQFINRYLLPVTGDSRLNHIIAVKDAGNHFRKALYPEYKAQREAQKEKEDPELTAQRIAACDAVEGLLKSLGVPIVDCPKTEADDVIAFLTQKLSGPKAIYTVDQDLLQLSSDETVVFLKGEPNITGMLVKIGKDKEELIIHPRHVALYKSIVGDSSDNYGGVKGLGPAAFAKLASEFGEEGLDDLCHIVDKQMYVDLQEAANSEQNKVLLALYDQRQQWRLGWQLACLHPEIVEARVGKAFHRLRWTKRLPSQDRLIALLQAHNCEDLAEPLEHLLPVQTLVTAAEFATESEREEALDELETAFALSPFVSIDWETTDQLKNPNFVQAANGREVVDMLSSTITGAGFTFGANLEHTLYFSFDHKDTHNLPRSFLLKLLERIPAEVPKVIQNTYFEYTVLKNSLGVELTNCHDTKVMASYVDENEPSGLKDCSKHFMNYDQIKYRDVIAEGKTMSDYSAEHVFKYGADDPLVTGHLYDFYRTIMEIEGTWEFCRDNEFLPIEQLGDSYIDGVTFDFEEMSRQQVEDQTTFDESMLKLRSLIKENQTPALLEKGVEAIYTEWMPEELAKFKGKGLEAAKARLVKSLQKDGLEALEGAELEKKATDLFLADLRADVIGRVTYQDFSQVEKAPNLAPTPVKLNPILATLGLPEIEKFEPIYLSAYLREHRPKASRPAQVFLDLMVPASQHTSTKPKDLEAGRGRASRVYKDFEEHACSFLEKKYEPVGSELNLDSPDQMVVLLYGMLGLPIRLRQFQLSDTALKLGLETPSAQANEDAIVTALAEDTKDGDWRKEALQALLAAKKAKTRLKMFYSVYPLWLHPIDDQVHPQINSCGTETRRPSGSNPNPLQWPKRGEGVKFRRCVLPNKKLGHDLVVSIDWSQQELRVAAALSMDPVLLDCYIGTDVEHVVSAEVRALLGERLYKKLMETGTKDVHTQTASGLLKKAYDEALALLEAGDKAAKLARNTAKPINFGGTYGIGPAKLARKLIAPIDVAKEYLQRKKEQYAKFEEWRDKTIELAHRQGYVTTVYGNRRHAHESLLSKDEGIRSHAERQGVNYLIQGVCADNLKRVLTELRHRRTFRTHGASLIAPIYDELAFSCHHSVAVPLILEVHEVMTRDIPGFAVPMLAEPSLGLNFGDQIEIGPFPTPESIQAAIDKALTTTKKEAA